MSQKDIPATRKDFRRSNGKRGLGKTCEKILSSSDDKLQYLNVKNYLLRESLLKLCDISQLANSILKDLPQNPSQRKRRIERREATQSLLAVILKHVDIATFKIIKFIKNGFHKFPTLQELAAKAGLHIKRAKRVLSELNLSRYIVTKRRADKRSDGTIKGLAAIRIVTEKLFLHLGISKKWLDKARKAKQLKRDEQISKNNFDEKYRAIIDISKKSQIKRGFARNNPANNITELISKFRLAVK